MVIVHTVTKCHSVINAGNLNDPDLSPEYRDRLPRDTEPIAYSVRLAPKYDSETGEFQFGGQVEILIRVNYITAYVTLNARDMVIKDVAITERLTQTDVPVVGHEMIETHEFLVIHTDTNLLAGRQYLVKVAFVGYLRPDMTGFYKSTYTVDGVNKYVTIIHMCIYNVFRRRSTTRVRPVYPIDRIHKSIGFI